MCRCEYTEDRKLETGEIPIYEPNLDSMVSRNMKAGRLHFTTDLASVLDDVEVVFSAVGTLLMKMVVQIYVMYWKLQKQ